LEAWAIAKLIEDLLSRQEAALTAGVLNPEIEVCGVSLGVGNRPRAGAGFVGG
jgi:hypothetical protein